MKNRHWIWLTIVSAIALPGRLLGTNTTVSNIAALQTALAGTADTIFITPGTYTSTSTLSVTRTVSIIGQPLAGNEVVINMTSTARHFTITGTGTVRLENLVLVGPNATYIAQTFSPISFISNGGGVAATTGTNTINISDCKIGGCSATGNGGGVLTTLSTNTVQITRAQLQYNTSSAHGGGIYAAGPLTINNTSIAYNRAGYNNATGIYNNTSDGGGIFANAVLTLQGNVIIEKDTAGRNGGGLYKGAGVINTWQLTTLNIISNNAKTAGGGIYTTVADTLENAIIRSNGAGTFGGGVAASANVILLNATLDSNRAGFQRTTGGNGGGLATTAAGVQAQIMHSSINNNMAWNNGGGIYAVGPLTLTNDTLSGNKACYDIQADTFRVLGVIAAAVGCGGGLFANNSLELSGAIVMERDTAVYRGGGIYKGSTGSLSADPDIDTTGLSQTPDSLFRTSALDTLIMSNCVTTGEGLARNGNPEGSQGGAIYTAVNTTINHARFFRNSAGDSGGAIFCDGNNNTLTLVNVTGIECKAGYNPFSKKYYADCSGGAICTPGKLVLSGDILLERDTAANTGGALCAYNTNSTVTSSNLRSLYIAGCATLYLTDTFGLYVPNFRGQGGAIVSNNEITLEASGRMDLLDNTSYTHGGALYSVLKGIAVKGANISGNTARYHGGGLYAPNGSVLIDSCRLSRNRAGFHPILQIDSGAYNGGAVYASKELRLRGAIIMDSNTANNNGGAIAKVLGGRFNIAEVSALRLRNNQTKAGPGGKGNGGAIYIEDSLVLNASINLEITGNRAAANGGAIYSKDKFLSLSELIIGNNQADSAGGAIWSGGPMEIIKVSLDSNTAGTNGGAVYSAAGKNNISGSTFFGNQAANGGAIYNTATVATDTNRIYNSTFSRNSAIAGSGGALYETGANTRVRITFATFNGNTASAGTAHAIYFTSATSKLLRGNIIYGNGAAGSELNQTAFTNAGYNIVREVTLPGTGNINLPAGNAANLFSSVVSGDNATLTDNGGLTQTIAIKKNGPAHNLVPLDTSTNWQARVAAFTTDQRDSLRPAGCKSDAGAYELQATDDAATYTLLNDTVCNNALVNADTLIGTTQFMADTLYFSNSSYTTAIAMPVQATEQENNVYVQFVTTSNCDVYDTLLIVTNPLVGDIGDRDTIAVAQTQTLTSSTPGGVWSSNDPAVAMVDQSGMVTGVSVGQTVILYTVTDATCGTSRTVTDTITVEAALSLRWVSFTGKYIDGHILLDWVTAAESNTSHFLVERSADGSLFSPITQLPASGNTVTNTAYRFTDQRPANTGYNYYRVKQVDLDGRFTYSTTIRLRSDDGQVFKAAITPNPATAVFTLSVEGVRDRESLLFELINGSGAVVYKERIIASGRSMSKTMQRPMITGGLYFYKVTRTTNQETYKGTLLLANH
ncbi:beta strand repeat-containing protein [Paraflavitalea pollutisoli]|uniref:beta strand repeat-containing protein n=1 Tax=Paraflavitalea pollutisoli TaxID=3034143 RepID=UPI0023EDDB60|nr:choice-of-anchor Q domain-containing protein [Paraflavitalea sp. H1-2-19X]